MEFWRIRVNEIDYEIAKFREDKYEEKDGLKIVPEDKKVDFCRWYKRRLSKKRFFNKCYGI